MSHIFTSWIQQQNYTFSNSSLCRTGINLAKSKSMSVNLDWDMLNRFIRLSNDSASPEGSNEQMNF